MAATDRKRLKEVSPDGTVIVLRLDPLSERNVKDILANTYGVEDTDGFIKTARDRGVKELLKNPQNLKLLAESVLRGKWPDSRKEMFQEACRWLVREPNPEHLAANPSNADIGPLIEAAGRLCAVQLLSGTAGYTLPDRAEPDDTYPSLAKVDGEATGRMRQVLGTRLFVGTSEGKLAPTHRQIAEFLAAQYVSGLLDGGLSAGADSRLDHRFRRRTGALLQQLCVLAGGAQQTFQEQAQPAGSQRADIRGRPDDVLDQREAGHRKKPATGVLLESMV